MYMSSLCSQIRSHGGQLCIVASLPTDELAITTSSRAPDDQPTSGAEACRMKLLKFWKSYNYYGLPSARVHRSQIVSTYNYHGYEFDEDETRRALDAAGLDRRLQLNLTLWGSSGLINLLHPLLEYSIPANDGNLEEGVAIVNCQYRSARDALATKQPPDGLAIYINPFRLQVVIEWWRSGLVPVGPELQKALSHAWILCEQDDTLDNPVIAEVIECFRACGFTTDASGIDSGRLSIPPSGKPPERLLSHCSHGADGGTVRGTTSIVVTDDGPGFQDITHAWTLMAPTPKRANPTNGAVSTWAKRH